MIGVVLLGATAAIVAAALVAVYARHHRRPRLDYDTDPRPLERRTNGVDGPMTLDAAVATIRDLADRVTLAEAFNRRLNAIVNVLLGTIAVVVLMVVVLVGVVFVVKRDLDTREADRVERTVATCLQDNVTAAHIDAGNNAKASIVEALAALQHQEIDALLAPLVANPGTPEAQAFADRYRAGRDAVEKALDEARVKIAEANVPARDCTPAGIAVFLSPTTTSSSS